MGCGEASLLALLSRSMRYGSDACASIITDASSFGSGGAACDDPPLLTKMIGAFTDDGRLRLQPASLGSVSELDCVDSNVPTASLIARSILPAIDGGYVILTWEDGEPHECTDDCDDDLTAEQRLRACFVRQENGVMCVRVTTTSDITEVECGEGEASEALLSRCLTMIAPGQYAIRITA